MQTEFELLVERYNDHLERVREEIWHWAAWKRIIFMVADDSKQVEWEREKYTKDTM
jgi:hypothetical protein